GAWPARLVGRLRPGRTGPASGRRWGRRENNEISPLPASPPSTPRQSSLSTPDPAEARCGTPVMSLLGDSVPWWRVVYADGTPASCHSGQAPGLLNDEGTPMLGARVDMNRARQPDNSLLCAAHLQRTRHRQEVPIRSVAAWAHGKSCF